MSAPTVCARIGCEEPIVQPRTGRPRRYCSGACKTASCRERHRLARVAADPLVALAFDPSAHRTFQRGDTLVSVPWFECWLAADMGYVLRDGSPLETFTLKLAPGPAVGAQPKREAVAA